MTEIADDTQASEADSGMQLHKVGWGAVGLLLVLLVVGWRGPEQSSLLEDGLSEDAVNVREGGPCLPALLGQGTPGGG